MVATPLFWQVYLEQSESGVNLLLFFFLAYTCVCACAGIVKTFISQDSASHCSSPLCGDLYGDPIGRHCQYVSLPVMN